MCSCTRDTSCPHEDGQGGLYWGAKLKEKDFDSVGREERDLSSNTGSDP